MKAEEGFVCCCPILLYIIASPNEGNKLHSCTVLRITHSTHWYQCPEGHKIRERWKFALLVPKLASLGSLPFMSVQSGAFPEWEGVGSTFFPFREGVRDAPGRWTWQRGCQ